MFRSFIQNSRPRLRLRGEVFSNSKFLGFLSAFSNFCCPHSGEQVSRQTIYVYRSPYRHYPGNIQIISRQKPDRLFLHKIRTDRHLTENSDKIRTSARHRTITRQGQDTDSTVRRRLLHIIIQSNQK